ncbi:MAG: AlpA family transcriptional regulator [Chlorobium phaeovibrioides]|nr:AlpA family transcriptional regulator [Chlorobium phaeovibrioides]
MSDNTRLLRIRDIIGDRARGIPAIIPVSKAGWYAGIRAGRYPKPIKLTEKTAVWSSIDIDALLEKICGGGGSQKEVSA